MGVLDIIDTNRLELSRPGVQLAMKEVSSPALSLISSFPHPVMSPGCSHIAQYQEGSSANKKGVSQGMRIEIR